MVQNTDLRLRAYAHILLRHKIAIVVVTVVAIVIGVTPALLEDPTYAAQATMRVRPDEERSAFRDDERGPNVQSQSRDLATEVEVIQSAPMRSLVIEHLGGEAPPFRSVTASIVGFSEVIAVRVTAPMPGAAADVANAYAEVFVEERQRQSVDALIVQSNELRTSSREASDRIAEIDQQLANPDINPVVAENLRVTRASLTAQVLEFNRRADELDVDAALREGGTEIVARAGLNLDPISPKPLRSATTAAVLGLLAGLAIAVLLEISQDRLSDPDDLKAVDPTVPVLGSIPHLDAPQTFGEDLSPVAREAYRYLWTSLKYQGLENPIRSVVVTSATSAEGKTTTATHLAAAAAESGMRTVLIDADLRRPSLHEFFGLAGDAGLVDVLQGTASFRDVVEFVQPTLAVIPAGKPMSHTSELLGGEAFAELVRTATSQSELVVIDVPPVLPVADPVVVARATDGAVVVARSGVVRRRELRELTRRLRDAQIPIVGFATNDTGDTTLYTSYEPYAT